MIQVSEKQASVGTSSAKLTLPSMLVVTTKVHTMPILGGLLCFTTEADEATMPYGRNSDLNLVALPIQALYELHQGVFVELKIREERALFKIKDIKSHNE